MENFQVCKEKWEMWKLEYFEYNAGAPLEIEIEYTISKGQDNESSIYYPPDFSKCNPFKTRNVSIDMDKVKAENTKDKIKRSKYLETIKRKENKADHLLTLQEIEKSHKIEIYSKLNMKRKEDMSIAINQLDYLARHKKIEEETIQSEAWRKDMMKLVRTKKNRKNIQKKYDLIKLQEFEED